MGSAKLETAEARACIEGFTNACIGGRKYFLVKMYDMGSAKLE